MDLPKDEWLRWRHLLMLSDSINEQIVTKNLTVEDIESHILSIEDAFKDYSDPIENFPSYVVHRFCRGLRHALRKGDSSI